ncbi:hypothetical protein C8R44DRAFT_864963 [Mycena epipterygia]|nr:hypothetical protein C8R44DRAFT_864963 [Mycena epipterygia]
MSAIYAFSVAAQVSWIASCGYSPPVTPLSIFSSSMQGPISYLFSEHCRCTDYFSRPLFTKITHLDLGDSPDDGWKFWSGLADMPCLTHLSFRDDYEDMTMFHSALLHCKSLQVLAILFAPDVFTLNYESLASDPRFVLVGVRHRELEWETANAVQRRLKVRDLRSFLWNDILMVDLLG